MSPPAAGGRCARRILILLLLLTAAPILLATAAYYWWPPRGGASYGQLIVQPLPVAIAPGHWVLASWAPVPCDADCGQRLDNARRLRVAQGEAASRLDVVWLYPPGATVRVDADDVHAVALDAGVLVALAPGMHPLDDLYLIDPHGNLVLRYPAGFEPRRALVEIGKVMKVNRGMG